MGPGLILLLKMDRENLVKRNCSLSCDWPLNPMRLDRAGVSVGRASLGVVSLPAYSGACSNTGSGVAVGVFRYVLLLGCLLILTAYCILLYLLLFFKLITVEEQQFLREALYNTGILIVWDPAPYHAEIDEVRREFSVNKISHILLSASVNPFLPNMGTHSF